MTVWCMTTRYCTCSIVPELIQLCCLVTTTHAYTYTYTHTFIHTRSRIHTHAHAYTHTCYAHTHTHTRTHTITQAKLGSVPTGEPEEDSVHHLSSLSSEQRLRNLELELAQTKLALVESQCKNQELEHRLEDATPPSTSSGGSSGGSSQGHRGSVRSWYFKKKT